MPSDGYLLHLIPIQWLSFTTFKEILQFKTRNITFMNSVYFSRFCVSYPKGSLNIPEYRCLLIGRVQYFYTIEHAVENITYHGFQSISVALLSLLKTNVVGQNKKSKNSKKSKIVHNLLDYLSWIQI